MTASAQDYFGDRGELAVAYHDWLADQGILRGLIGPREVTRLWQRHILNSAVVSSLCDQGSSVVDIGSGAGLPGIPMHIARPDLSMALVEPLLRRTTFLDEVIEDLGLSTKVHRGRAEEKHIVADVGGADYVTSRAVAPLGKLVRWSAPLCRKGGKIIALKGSSAREEIERDARDLKKAGVRSSEIVTLNDPALESPTTVVVMTIGK